MRTVPAMCADTDSNTMRHGGRTTESQTSAGSDSVSPGAHRSPSFPPMNPLLAIRSALTGILMGIANLIPGVSGGTMILAMGLYEEFISAVADVTALRLSWRRIIFLGIVGGCAAGAIVGLAGVILYLLFHYTVAMFALFIGLTLGGAPLLYRAVRPIGADVVVATAVGLAAMLGVLLLKSDRGFPHNMAMDFTSGIVGATTMVLPGISGSYMLLVLDQYDRIIGAIHDFKEAAQSRDIPRLKEALRIVIPVGVGAVLGIVLLSNLLKLLLKRFHRVTVGALLGILLGSVLGLWPFSQTAGHKALEARSLAEIRAYAQRWSIPEVGRFDTKEALIEYLSRPEVWKRGHRPPIDAGAATLAIVMAVIGFGMTAALSRLGRESSEVGAGETPRSPSS